MGRGGGGGEEHWRREPDYTQMKGGQPLFVTMAAPPPPPLFIMCNLAHYTSGEAEMYSWLSTILTEGDKVPLPTSQLHECVEKKKGQIQI